MKEKRPFYHRMAAVSLVTVLLVLLVPSLSQAADTYQFLTEWGSYGPGDGQFDWPSGVAVDTSGNVYVADHWNNRIQKFTANGTFVTMWGSLGAGDGEFSFPSSIAVDTLGNVYVADRLNFRIQKFTSDGTFLDKWGAAGTGDGQFNNAYGIAVDTSGNVYVADTGNQRIQKFTSDGTFITKWGAFGPGDGQFYDPFGVAVDGSGNVYVADTVNNRIQRFTSTGNFLTTWGSQGAADGEFFYPFGLAVDTAGDVYVADTFNHRVQKFASSGAFLTKWGTQGSGEGEFNGLLSVAVDGSGNVYVVDTFNDRIQKFGTTAVNLPPVVAANDPTVNVPEGTLAGNSGTVSDPNGDPVVLEASIGAVSDNGDGTWSWSYPTTDGPVESQTVTITATDDDNEESQAAFELIVNNVAPNVGAVIGPIAPIAVNAAVFMTAGFTDPGTADTHTATWNWGDASSAPGDVTIDAVSGSHAYETPGIYAVEVVVIDKDGASGTSTFEQFIVVYDPEGGFVTGGGWIDSPAGAYALDPSLTGKANFGFVSKYKKGASVPTGETNFKFNTGGLHFHSTSYDWLVIAGGKAQYKGVGTINGQGSYGFMLTATDGTVKGGFDKFRIKIWEIGGGIVYDNNMGANQTDDPATALGGGSIVVHKG